MTAPTVESEHDPRGTGPTAGPTVTGPTATGPTVTGPTVRTAFRSSQWPALAVVAFVVAAVLLALVSARGPSRRLDPDSVGPSGARALAQVLREGGVPVRRLETVDEVVEASRPESTLLIPVPQALVERELEQLGELASALVVVGAQDEHLKALDLPVEVQSQSAVEQRRPACALEVAARAGDADLGGLTYRATEGTTATGCYAVSGEATLLRVPSRGATLLGAGSLLTNERLDDRGNAALALGLLSERGGEVLWLVPRPGRDLPAGARPSFRSLLPDGLGLGVLQLFVALAVVALWRARRLGRVVEEPLPVVVRAAEAVEGRSRLYRAAHARDSASGALRAATRERLARQIGMAASLDPSALVSVVAERAGRDPAAIGALLYGDPPGNDATLVRLVADLRALETDLTGPSSARPAPPTDSREDARHDARPDDRLPKEVADS